MFGDSLEKQLADGKAKLFLKNVVFVSWNVERLCDIVGTVVKENVVRSTGEPFEEFMRCFIVEKNIFCTVFNRFGIVCLFIYFFDVYVLLITNISIDSYHADCENWTVHDCFWTILAVEPMVYAS